MAGGGDESWDQQKSLEGLLGDSIYEKLDAVPQQAYSGSTPAQQHENLLYSSNNDKMSVSQEISRSGSQLSGDRFPLPEEGTLLGMVATGTSFAGGGGLPWQDSPTGILALETPDTLLQTQLQKQQQKKQRQQQSQEYQQQPALESDFFSRADSPFALSDDLASSQGSSIYSEMPTPTYSSSIPHQAQPWGGPTAYLSPSGVRSPSSSLRAGSYLSTSIRNSSSTTPRSRHASLSGSFTNGGDSILSASVPKSMSHLSTDDRLKRKREFHNAVERRRRELIKQKIKELGTIVPPSLLNYDLRGKQVKPNKGIILHKTVEYLEYLLQVLEAQDRKKAQLATKLQELQDKERNLRTTHAHENAAVDREEVISNTKQTSSQDDNDEFLSGKIIDSRFRPQTLDQGDQTPQWASGTDDGTDANCLAPTSNNFPSINDDLRQFLSGDLIEAEDNAKLMFGEGEANPTDYLLKFDS